MWGHTKNTTKLRTFKICNIMAKIKSEAAYDAALKRIEYLEDFVDDDTAPNDPNALELDMLIDLVEEYEAVHYPIGKPSLMDSIKLRMYEMGLSIQNVANLLEISTPQMNNIMRGKTEPSLSLTRNICKKLNISPEVALGM